MSLLLKNDHFYCFFNLFVWFFVFSVDPGGYAKYQNYLKRNPLIFWREITKKLSFQVHNMF